MWSPEYDILFSFVAVLVVIAICVVRELCRE